ncbi:MAG TPA: sigma-70 family RNA polymerase sigma factor [Verrucomicrobiota bacterium]|nr:sigma-70 family RNA polymerase sigma factor [Verrucomicrobiota bacterium]
MHAQSPRPRRPAPDGALFPETLWSIVNRAQEDSTGALNSLFSTYREPLVTYLRCRGSSPEDAEDIVHGFAKQLQERDFLRTIASTKGRFRTFLLTALRNFLSDLRAKQTAGIRGGGQEVLSLDQPDEEGRPLHEPAGGGCDPSREFDRIWVRRVINDSLRRLAEECARGGKFALWTSLEPVLHQDATAAAYEEIAKQLCMTVGAVKMAKSRLRTRLSGLIRDAVLQTVGSQEDLEDELRYLLGVWSS